MFNGYTITETLHRGGKSIIYRAIRDEDRTHVIIKSIAGNQQRPIDIARLDHECKLLDKLLLQGIPEIIGFETEENKYGIIFKDHLGISLKKFLTDEQPEIGYFLNIAIQLCNILAGLHAHRIIHKDIKPSNIIIQAESGEIQLVDFSLSTRSLSGQHVASGTGILEGSLPYISPEQTGRMNRPVDYRSDLYSLGVTLYEIATGHLPFSASHPLEWVHAHLAQTPPDPRMYREDLPGPIAEIIMILLAKTSEDRYQSAYNLKKDFEKCAAQWKNTGKVEPFEFLATDSYGLYMMPAKLYGREKQILELSDLMTHVVKNGAFECLLISGYSGIGKTVLVQEARKQISIANGHFASGKFELLNKSTPYFGFIHAFNDLSRQLMAERDDDLMELKSRLLEALGSNVQIINQLVPSFEMILGKHPEPPPLLPEEAANRFQQTLKTFVKNLAGKDKPLILFFDDLQWADMASLTLLEQLTSDCELKSLGILGSYRNNEVDSAHPLYQSIIKARENIQVNEIVLENLNVFDIENLLFDSFKRSSEETGKLARLLHAKTQGNPFFIVQALSNFCEEGIISFDTNTGLWFWDYEQLNAMKISDNVADLMVSKIQKLNINAQESLKLAACIGNAFSLSALVSISKPDIIQHLSQALEQGLILSRDDNYVILSRVEQLTELFYEQQNTEESKKADARFRFLHDRVQQAAYSLLSEEHKKNIHLTLGRNLIKYLDEDEKSDQIFSICNHLNNGRELIETENEKNELASLNLQASRKAKGAAAYAQAMLYGNLGLSLLTDESKRNYYSIWYGLNFVTAECNYILGEFSRAENTFGLLIHDGRSRMDKLLVYRAMVDMYSMSADRKKVIDTVAAALSLFHIRMPVRSADSKVQILLNIGEIKWRLRNKINEDIIQGAVCKDEEHIKLAELILEAGPSVYLSNQDLFAWLVLFEVRYALRLGNTPSSPLGFTGYGMILHTALGDMDMAFRMAELGEKLNFKLGNPFPYYKLKYVKYLFISHFREDVSPTIHVSEELAKVALAAGDSLYYGLIHFHIINCRIFLGHSLNEINKNSSIHLKQLTDLNNNYAYQLIQCRIQFLLSLAGQEQLPWIKEGRVVSMEEKIEQFKQEMGYTNMALLYTSNYALYYLMGDHEESIINYLNDGLTYLNYVLGSFSYLEFALYQSLSCFKILHQNKISQPGKCRKIIRLHRNILKKYTAKGPENYHTYFQLVDMCWQIINGKEDKIMRNAEALLNNISQKHQLHLSAISKEIIGQLYLTHNQEKIAKVYLTESAQDFENWGAIAKRKKMTELYSNLNLYPSEDLDTVDDEQNETISTQSKHGLDLSSLMKSATTISGEIILGKLLPSLINIVVENAGANKGILILVENGKLILKARRDMSKPEVEIFDIPDFEQSQELSKIAVRLAERTEEVVLSDNALFDERFKNDPYVKNLKTKSLLCMPILHQGTFRGVLYLENDLISHGFSPERVSVIQILCSQIAVSLDNAILYHNLEEALDKQVILTEAYSRFTPKEYLRFLGHDSILDVKLGDYRVENMTVLFSDIRSYTTIAEQFTAEENFLFLSDYLEKMSEIVYKHHGMVNQLLGDGILAFFDKSQNALNASIEMQQVLQNYKIKGKGDDMLTIKAGVGLHSGEVIIGIMGSATSMDTGIVSDTVNAAARIEGLNKHFGVNILLSENVLKQLDKNIQREMRPIGRVIMKGKQNDIGLFECFNGDTDELRLMKQKQLSSFIVAFEQYCDRNFKGATETFVKLLEDNAQDALLKYYLKKAKDMIDKPIPSEWTAVEDVQIK